MNASGLTKSLAKLCTILLCTIIFWFYFSAPYFDPDHILTDHGFDGFKNYFTFGYYIKNSEGFWFDGMAYPTGDNVIFADAQPALSFPLQLLNKVFPWIGTHTAIIASYLVLFGVLLGALVIFKLFRFYGVDIYPAIIFSVLIALFSPQIFRMSLHHSLSYVFIVPTTMWLHLQAVKNDKSSVLKVVLAAWGVFITFIHSYYLLMYGMYLGGYYLIRFLFDKKRRLWDYIAVLFPFVFFLCYLKLLGLGDRPETAWGFFNYRAKASDLFLPHTGYFADALNGVFPKLDLKTNEGSAYLGIVGLLGLGVLLVRAFRVGGSTHIKTAILAVIPITLFSMQIPFIWLGEEWIKSLPILQQFRGTGRFAWFFYYVITIYGVIELVKVLSSQSNRTLQTVLLAGLAGLFLVELSFHLTKVKTTVQEYSGHDALEKNDAILKILNKHNISPDTFKSVIMVPPSTTGSEKIRLYDDYDLKMEVWPFCMQHGIPTTSINLSRTPVSTVLKSLALVCNEYTPKPGSLKIDQGCHLVVIRDYTEESYYWLKSISTHLGKYNTLGVYMIDSKNLMGSRSLTNKQVQNCSSSAYPYFSGFDSSGTTGLIGNGLEIRNEYRERIDISNAVDSVEVSFWYRVVPDRSADVIEVSLAYKHDEGWIIKKESFSDIDVMKFEVLENWIRFNKSFDIPDRTIEIELSLKSKNAIVDNLMVRDLQRNVLFEEEGLINYNNNLIPAKRIDNAGR